MGKPRTQEELIAWEASREGLTVEEYLRRWNDGARLADDRRGSPSVSYHRTSSRLRRTSSGGAESIYHYEEDWK